MLIIGLLISISAVSASDTNDSDVLTSDNNTVQTSTGSDATGQTKEIRGSYQANDENQAIALASSNNDEILSYSNEDLLGDAPGTFTELRNLINSASAGSTLNLTKNYTYSSGDIASGIEISKTITIDGKGMTLDGNNAARIFKITGNNVVLKNINFINGYNGDTTMAVGGGAIFVQEGSTQKHPLTIINSTFKNNRAWRGGAIYGSSLIINNSTFISNSAIANSMTNNGGAGGSIAIDWIRANVLIENSRFENNSARSFGGAVFIKQGNTNNDMSKLNIVNSNFTSNSAGGLVDYDGGGALYSQQNTEVYILGSRFEKNFAKADREGGVMRHSGNVYIYDSQFFENTARDGAALCSGADSTILEVYNSLFSKNVATRWGGALQERNFVVDNCVFNENTAGSFGGAFYGRYNTGFITRSNFTKNTAPSGAAIHFEYRMKSATVSNCIFTENNASTYGGAINKDFTGTLYVIDSEFNKNSASYGGAINVRSANEGPISVDGSTFIDNKASIEGGAINLDASNAKIYDSEFKNNNAPLGGAIYMDASDGLVSGSKFTDNTANNGTSVYWRGDSGTLEKNKFADSNPKSGSVYWHGSQGTILRNEFDGVRAIYLCSHSSANLDSNIQKSNNLADYSISVNGNVQLIDNEFNNAIYNFGNITSQTYVETLENTTIISNSSSAVVYTAVKDDNGNYIKIIQNLVNVYKNQNLTTVFNNTHYISQINNLQLGYHQFSATNYTNSGLSLLSKMDGAILYLIINLTINQTNYGQIVTINATVVNTTYNGTIDITVNKIRYNVTLNNGSAILKLYDVAPNTYDVIVSYTTYNQTISINGEFTVSLRNSTLIINANNVTYGKEILINITVTNGTTGNVLVFVNNGMYVITLKNSTGQLNLTGLAGGDYTVYAVYNGNTLYSGSYNNTKFTVSTSTPSLIIDTKDITVGQTATIKVTVPDDITGKVYVYVGSKEYIFNKTSISIDVDNLTAGNVTVRVVYGGDNKYLAASNNTTFIVRKNNISLTASDDSIFVGQNAVIDITLHPEANGIVLLTINGTTYSTNANGGLARFIISGLQHGKHNFTATYLEDEKFLSHSTNATLTVNYWDIYDFDVKYNLDSDLNVVVNVTIPADANGDVLVEINGTNYTGYRIKGNVVISVNGLNAGEYNATVYFVNDTKYDSKKYPFTLNLERNEPAMGIVSETIFVGQDGIITVTLPNDATGNVTLTFKNNNTNITKALVNGEAVFTLPGLKEGEYDFYVNYTGNRKYLPVDKEHQLSVNKIHDYDSMLVVEDIHVGETATIGVFLPNDAGGKVNITINGTTYTLNITNGYGSVNVSGLKAGNHLIVAKYTGDDKYEACARNYTDFNVRKIANYPLDFETSTNATGANITVVLPSDATGTVNITINGQTYYNQPVKNGKVTISVDGLDPATEYPIQAWYSGDDKYTNGAEQMTLHSDKTNHYDFTIAANNIHLGETAYIYIYLPNATDGDLVTITIPGRGSVDVRVNNGTVVYPVADLDLGTYHIEVRYNGNDKYEPSRKSGDLTVSKITIYPITVDANTPEVGKNLTVNVTLPDDAGGNVTVTLTINNQNYTVNVTNGSALVVVPDLPEGEYNATVQYSGDGKYNPRSEIIHISVVKVDNFKFESKTNDTYVGQTQTIKIYLPEDITGNVTITIDNTDYINQKVEIINGFGTFNATGLKHAQYVYSVSLINDTKYDDDTIFGNFEVLEISDYKFELEYNQTVNVRDNITFTIKLPNDASGNVTVRIFDDNYSGEVFEGVARINVTAPLHGTYPFIVSFEEKGKYTYKSQSGTVTVNKVDIALNPTYKVTVNVDESVTFTFDLPSDATGEITIVTRGIPYIGKLENGHTEITVPGYPQAQTYSPTVSYNGDTKYNMNTTFVSINVVKVADYDLNVTVKNITVGQSEHVIIDLPNDATDDVLIYGNFSTQRFSELIRNGHVNFDISYLAAGTYNITVEYQGYAKYENKIVTKIFTVSKVNSTIAIELINNNAIEVTVPGDATGNVTISIGNKKENVTILNGKATLDISDLEPGDYEVNASYDGDGKYFSNKTNKTINIPKITDYNLPIKVVNITVGADAIIEITVPGDADGYVNLTIGNGEVIQVQINGGKAIYNAGKLAVDNYDVKVSYENNKYALKTNTSAFKVNKIKTVLTPNVVSEDQKVNISVSINENATGNITIYVDSVPTEIPITNNQANLSLTLAPGLHVISIEYPGDANHTDVSEFTTVNVAKIADYNLPIIVKPVITVLENNTVLITLPDTASDHIDVYVNGVEYEAILDEVTKIAKLVLSNLTSGNYTVYVSYQDDSHEFVENTTKFTVIKLNTTLDVKVNNITKDLSEVINITFDENVTGNVLIIVNGTPYIKTLENGKTNLTLPNLADGNYTVIVNLTGNSIYNDISLTTNFTVSKIPVNITVKGDNIVVGKDLKLTIELSKEITDLITVKIGDETYTTFVYKGKGNLTASNLAIGNYNVTVYYDGDVNYVNASNSTKINVTGKKETRVTVKVDNITYGEDAVIYVNVTGADTGFVTLSMAGNPQTKEVVNGKVNFTVSDLLPRDYHLTVAYVENDDYLASSATADFTVNKKDISVKVDVTNSTVGDIEYINVTVTNGATGHVLININGTHYYDDIENGVAKFNISGLNVGNYTIEVSFDGDTIYKGFNVKENLTITKRSTLINITGSNIVVGYPEVFTITTSANITEVVTIKIGEKTYTTFVENGKGTFTVYDLAVGEYTAYVYFPGNTLYGANDNFTKFNVSGKNKTSLSVKVDNITYGENATIYVNVTGADTGFVTLSMAGNPQTKEVVNGKVNFTVSGLAPRDYHLTVAYVENDDYLASSATADFKVNKKQTPIKVDLTNSTVGSVENINITLNENATGNVLITIGGLHYYGELEDGIARFDITGLLVGNYTAVIKYLGDDIFNETSTTAEFKVTRIPTLINITGSPITIGEDETLIIKTSENITALVKVSINGTNYTTFISNGKGSLVVRDLASGVYNATVYYNGDDEFIANSNYTIFTVNAKSPSAVTINVNNITVGEKLTVGVNVTEGATGNVTLVIGGNTYTKTLTDGKVSFTIENLTARDYHVTAYYRGNDYYLISNSTAEVTVYRKNSPISATVTNSTVGSIEYINVTLPDKATGYVLININGTHYYGEIENEVAKFNITGLLIGNYTAEVTYMGDDDFMENSTKVNLTISKLSTLLNITGYEIIVGEDITLTVKTSQNITALVKISINGTNYTTFINEGLGNLTVRNLASGVYNATVYYNGDDEYLPVSNSTLFNVKSKSKSEITIKVDSITVGDNATVYVNVTDGAEGIVSIVVGGNVYTKDLVDSKATFIIENLSARDYHVTAYYFGDNHYLASNNTAEFTVNKKTTSLNVTGKNITVGESVTLNIKITDGTTGVVLIKVNDLDYYTEINNGNTKLTLSNLAVGEYSVTVTYNGDENYSKAVNYTSFNVTKVTPEFEISLNTPDIVSYGQNVVIKVTGPRDVTGVVEVKVENEPYTVYINNGEGYLTVEKPSVGKYNVSATYLENYKYESAISNIVGFEVYMSGSDIDVNAHRINVGDTETITVTFPEGKFEGQVTITIDGTPYTANIEYNATTNISTAKLEKDGFESGIHEVGATYTYVDGEGRTILYEGKTFFTVDKIESSLSIDPILDIKVDENVTIKLNINPGDATGTINVYINGQLHQMTTDNLTLIVPGLAGGHYNVQAFYEGNNKYLPSNATASFNVGKHNTTIKLNVSSIDVGSVEQINVTLPADATGYVLINVNGTHYYAEINNGVASVNVTGLTSGKYNVTATFVGDDKYLGNKTNTTFTVSKLKTLIKINGSDIIVGHDEIFNITTSENLTVVVKIEIDGKNYTSFITNGKGTFTISDLQAKSYTAKVYFDGNDDYEAVDNFTTFTVSGKGPSNINVTVSDITVGENATVYVNVTPGATGRVSVVIGGTAYTKDLVDGKANFTIENLTARLYHVTAYYNGDDNYLTSNNQTNFTVNKKETVIKADVTNSTVGSLELINITVPEGATGSVLININGTNYYATIKENVAKFEISGLAANNYTATVTYNGDDVFNSTIITIKFTVSKIKTYINITSTNITVDHDEVIKFNITENITGIVTLEIDGANTTSFVDNGIGQYIISGLGIGSHTVKIYYDGDDKYVASLNETTFNVTAKKPSEVKINVTDITVGDDAIIKVNITSGATGNVTIIIGGHEYTNETNNGEVTFAIKDLAARDYEITAIYNGDDEYLGNTTTANFTVNKKDPNLDLNVSNIRVGDNEIINITVNENATGLVLINVNGTGYYRNLTAGKTSLTVTGLSEGNYNVNITYLGDAKFRNATASKPFTVNKKDPNLNVKVEDGKVVVTLLDDATGKVNITVGDTTTEVDVINGKATLDISDLAPGKYNITANYSGNAKYDKADGKTTYEVPKLSDYNLPVKASNTTVGNPVTIEVTVPEGATGKVNITVGDGATQEVEIKDGKATLTLTLDVGEYDVNVAFADNTYDLKTNSTKVKVSPTGDYNLPVSATNVTVGTPVTIEVTVPEGATGKVNITVGDRATEEVDIIGGKATLTLPLDGGEYDVIASFADKNHTLKTNSTKVKVSPISDYTLPVEVQNITVIQTEKITVTVPDGATGKVNITVTGRGTDEVDIVGGKATLPVSGLGAGEYTVTVSFADKNHTLVTNTTKFTVSKLNSTVTLQIANIKEGDSEIINITVITDATGKVFIDVGEHSYYKDLTNGKATLTLTNLATGKYDVNVTYEGDSKYNGNSTKGSFNVTNKKVAPITVEAPSVDEGETATITVKVPADATGNITIKVNGQTITKEVQNGEAKFEVSNLPAGSNSIDVTYTGDDDYKTNSTSSSIKVNSKGGSGKEDATIQASDVNANYNSGNSYTTRLVDSNGNPISNEKVSITVDGTTYERTTDANGYASVPVPKDAGDYNVIVSYSGSDKYNPAVKTGKISISSSIKADDMKRGWNSPYDYQATFFDKNGNPLANTNVKFKVNGKTYTVKTDKNGVAKLSKSKLKVGTYDVTVINPVTGEQITKTAKIIKRILENKDITKDYLNGTHFTVLVIGDDGNPVGAGKVVTFKINGITYKLKTDKTGHVTRTIGLIAGKYTMKTSYKGYTVKNKVVVKPILKAKNVKVKYGKKIKFKATLKYTNGKVLKNKKLTIKFKGKTYKVKTNKKGVATLTIKTKVKPGKYTISTRYVKQIIRNKITVKR